MFVLTQRNASNKNIFKNLQIVPLFPRPTWNHEQAGYPTCVAYVWVCFRNSTM